MSQTVEGVEIEDVGPEQRKAIMDVAAGLLLMLIGPRGGGKTTAADWFVQDSKENKPNVPIVSNVPITGAVYVPEIIKFLETKLIVEGGEKNFWREHEYAPVTVLPRNNIPTEMLVIIDEAAISGFEARGSGLFSLDSYILALSRKLNVDIILISQLMSMVEKRGQWLADFYWLCERKMIPGTKLIDYFRYRVYDEEFRKTNEFHVSGERAEEELFGNFDTFDIPNYTELAVAFRNSKSIRPEDQRFYNNLVAYYHGLQMQREKTWLKQDEWFSRRLQSYLARVEMAA